MYCSRDRCILPALDANQRVLRLYYKGYFKNRIFFKLDIKY